MRAVSTDADLVARGLVAGTIGLLVAYIFLSGEYEKQLWLLLGLLATIPTVARSEVNSLGKVGRSVTPRLPVGSGLQTGAASTMIRQAVHVVAAAYGRVPAPSAGSGRVGKPVSVATE